jgi:hypothetical protein
MSGPSASSVLCMGWLLMVGSFILCLSLAIWQTTVYQKGQTLERQLQWTLCNTTEFHIDPPQYEGLVTVTTNTCEWQQLALFNCYDMDSRSRCIRDNTHRFNNPEWDCVIHMQNNKPNCQVAPLTDWPDMTTAHQALNGAIVLYIIAAVFLVGLCGLCKNACHCTYKSISP